MKEPGRPGQTDPRLELPPLWFVECAAVAVLAGQEELSGSEVDVRLAVGHFYNRLVVFPSQAEIQRQVGTDLEIVLKEQAGAPLPVSPTPGETAAALGPELIQQK